MVACGKQHTLAVLEADRYKKPPDPIEVHTVPYATPMADYCTNVTQTELRWEAEEAARKEWFQRMAANQKQRRMARATISLTQLTRMSSAASPPPQCSQAPTPVPRAHQRSRPSTARARLTSHIDAAADAPRCLRYRWGIREQLNQMEVRFSCPQSLSCPIAQKRHQLRCPHAVLITHRLYSVTKLGCKHPRSY